MIVGKYICLDCKIATPCKYSDTVSKFETKIPTVIEVKSCPSFIPKDEDEDEDEDDE